MSNNYKPVSERAKALYGDDVCELDLSAEEEQDALRGGHLEMVPRNYRALVNNFSKDGQPVEQGAEFEGSLLVDVERSLVEGGVIERVEDEKPKKAAAKKALAKKADDSD